MFDTCFLIDLEREMQRGSGKAYAFLQQHPSARPCLSWTIAGKFAEGFGDIHHPACAAMLAHFEILPMDESTAHHYAVCTRLLRSKNQLIGANDHIIGSLRRRWRWWIAGAQARWSGGSFLKPNYKYPLKLWKFYSMEYSC